ncbi:hypothetical protein KGMB02408_27950 [Bacteroides faecalis]|uniref:Uncharacterized protein n=1 Tax=Bacteroides faecalis TaxID=2447885 RepID=A0A401LWG4_9BACE|nr:hypothetical protein KGMB02408_27950 [Bacteroides faecalis]
MDGSMEEVRDSEEEVEVDSVVLWYDVTIDINENSKNLIDINCTDK